MAKRSSVSVATVSRVLNAPAMVLGPTRERVLAAIDELGYFPNAAARAINLGRTRIVGALVPTLDNAIFARFLDGLENRLADFGLSLVVATTGEDPNAETVKARALMNVGAEGLIVSGISHASGFVDLTTNARIPVVAISHFDADYIFPTVGYDNSASAELAIQHLHGLGHRNMAVIHGPQRHNDRTRLRIATLERFRLPVRMDYQEAEISIRGGCLAAARALDGAVRPTAFLCLSDVLATGVLYELQRRGFDIPRDVSVTGMEDLPSSEFVFPALTSVRLPVADMGTRAAEAIANWVESGRPADPMELPVELVARSSTGPPSPAG